MRLEQPIRDECAKLISRYFAGLATDRRAQNRFQRVSGTSAQQGKTKHPVQWRVADHFNPFRVRAGAPRIAHSIERSLDATAYSPRPALIIPIPKPGGGFRNVSVFSVADAGVGSFFFRKILSRNQSRLSPFSYAYRDDLGAQDAVSRLARMFGDRSRFYSVEFDFSKYFDTIRHDYLLDVLRRHFKVTRTELHIINSFLVSRRAFGPDNYKNGRFVSSGRGIPQGNSLSLFLANVACHELDIALGSEGFQFARYADDIVVVCKEDHAASHAFELISRHCERTGLAINFAKSEGIVECSPQGINADLSGHRKSHIDYLGHRLQYRVVNKRNHPAPQLTRRVSIRPATEGRIRSKLSGIVYSHLLRYPEAGHFSAKRIDGTAMVDWDLVTCINDLRGYIYGGMDERHLVAALGNRTVRLHQPAGTMAFFPQVTDLEQLKALDGWLVNSVYSALTRREFILRNRYGCAIYPSLTRKDLLQASWYDPAKVGDVENDVRLPSFVRAWKYAHRSLRSFNLRQFPSRAWGSGDELYG